MMFVSDCLSVCSLFVSTLILKVPQNGPEGFLNDYTLKTKESEPKSNPNVNTCEQCNEQCTAVSYCSVCSAFLCESCTLVHKTLNFLKSHKIKSLESGRAYLPVKKDKILPCSQHPDKSLELYCKTCQCLVCTLCIVASHNGHKFGNIDSETRKGVEEQIEDLVAEVESKLAEYEINLEYISKVEKETVDEPVQIKGEINSLFDSLVTTLESRRAVLLETVEVSFNKDLKELWAQKEHMETTIAGLKGTLTFAKRSLQCAHDLELLLLGSQVMARLKELNKLQWERESTEIIDMTTRKFYHKEPAGLDTLGELITRMMTAESNDLGNTLPVESQDDFEDWPQSEGIPQSQSTEDDFEDWPQSEGIPQPQSTEDDFEDWPQSEGIPQPQSTEDDFEDWPQSEGFPQPQLEPQYPYLSWDRS